MRLRVIAICAFLAVFSAMPVTAGSPSNNGQYTDLIRSYECRRDRKQYGQFHNYGYWKGGRWCGYVMPGGYYVYVDGVWYIWRSIGPGPDNAAAQSDAAAQTGER